MNIGIVGLGLIGGSMGWDLKSLGFQVLGVSRREQTCQTAIALGIVDQASVDLSLMAAAEVVVICTPLAAIAPTMEELIPHLSPAAIVTDVGSVKTPVVQALSSLWPNFVGGHPMAGTAESGIEAAQRDLFVNRPYVITPAEATPTLAVEKVEEMARALRSHVYRCRPEDHDRAVAWISHLPVMVSSALIAASMNELNPDIVRLAQQFASSGFRDTSRVGGGNPELGVMMARYNRAELLRSLSIYRDCLDALSADIEREDWQAIAQKLTATQQARGLFLKTEE
ncbi:MAG: prephenate/arogenate dehydrogenase [Actinomycetota bacterium]